MKKRLVVIDGKSIFYRGFYAMANLSNSKGVDLGGVYGFALLALNVIKKLRPDYVAVAWDKSKTNIRSRQKIYPEYKAQRYAAPASFYEQIPILFELLQAFNWPLYELDDYEADDIMATFAKLASQEGLETVLVSSDLDLLQALSKNVKIFLLKKGLRNIEEFDEAEFLNKYQIQAQQFRDLKALMGDSSDNIPGVMGIGRKTATDLLLQYQTLDRVYDNLADIKPTIAQKLKEHKEMAYLSRQLVTLMDDIPLKLDLDLMSISNLDYFKLQTMLRELEFYSLIPQIPEGMKTEDMTDFVDQVSVKLKKPKVVEAPLSSLQDLDWSQPVLVHSYCQGRFGEKVVYLLVSNNCEVVQLYRLSGKKVNLKLKQALIYGYDTKLLSQVLMDLGVQDIVVEHDLKVANFLLHSSVRIQSLSTLAADSLGYIGELDELTEEDFRLKANEIVAIITAIKQKQLDDFKQQSQLLKVAQTIDYPFIPVLARLERHGMLLDKQVLHELYREFTDKLQKLSQQIYDLAGEEFNLASPSQLSKILYGKLKIPTKGIKRNKTGFSTDAESLKRLQSRFPIIVYILQWREIAKLQGTYVEGLLDHIDEYGRVRSEMQMTVASTGRLSSSNPNLQNIPIKTEIGSSIRRAFIAPEGYQIISADYSQFELRLIAVLAKDKDLIKAFQEGEDIHKLTASFVFEVALDKVTKQQRYLAKTINFGIIYGQGPHGLANLTGMTFTEARDFIDKYFRQRPLLKRYQDDMRKFATTHGYVETLFGRRRQVPDINSPNPQLREAAFRQAINMPIQGTEADLMKMAMVVLEQKLDADCHQIMQIHDSILVEAPITKVADTTKLMAQTMENIYPKLGVELKVDTTVASHWPIS